MLLRIDIFAQADKASSDSDKPSQTLYASPATVANRRKADREDSDNNSDPNAGVVATVGRKGDVDILFGMDRSISRQHALLRFVASSSDGKRKSSGRKTRGKKTDVDGSNADNESLIAHGCLMGPRNDDERSACDESPYGMCLVLENMGKVGSYVASKDECYEEDDDNKRADEKDNAGDDSDATTDDENAAIGTNHANASQSNYGMATSLATQTGEIIISRKNLSSSQKLPPLSRAIQQYFGSETPVKLTKIDVDETHVLNFNFLRSDGINTENKSNGDGSFTESSSVLIQFGCAQLPTIKITVVPMNVVFSSGVPSSIQNYLRLCGGLAQESGTLPRKESNGNGATTHLVAPERMAVAKQLIAWCYSIPIVSPDFILALKNHQSLEAPFPLSSDFPAKATDTNAFWDLIPDPNLLSNYIMISVDPSPDVEQAEGLAKAAGAKLEQLYDKKKKYTKARVQALLKHVKSLLDTASNTTSPQKVFLLSSKTKSKYSNANTTLLLKQLKEDLPICPVTSKILAKTITQQESILVGIEPSSNDNIDTNGKNEGSSNDTSTDRTRTNASVAAADQPSSKKGEGHEESSASPGLQLRKKRGRENKHNQNETCAAESVTMESQSRSNVNDCEIENNEGNGMEEEMSMQPSKRRKVGHQEKNEQVGSNSHSDNGEEAPPVSSAATASKNTTSKDSKLTEFGRADTNGWLKAAPKDDRERSKWRQRASEAYQKKTGSTLEPSASTSGDPRILVPSAKQSTNNPLGDPLRTKISNSYANHNRRQHDPNLPNYKRFRKNCVPMADPSEEVVVLLDTNFAPKSQNSQELSAEDRELQENQRLANALFKGDSMFGMGKKKRQK